MSTLQFEGATQGITETQLSFIEDVLKKRGISNKTVQIEVVGASGDNYMSNVKRFVVPDVDGKPFKMIAKFAPTIEHIRLTYNSHYAFENEHVMYTEVLPKFKRMQIFAGVPEADMLRFAECYGTYMEEPHEIILLEDLSESNFVMLDRLQSLSDECIKSVLRNFAIFHSLSFALKNKEPESFDKYQRQLHDIWTLNNRTEARNYYINIGEQAFKLMADNEKRLSVLKEAPLADMASFSAKLTRDDAVSKYNVIQQGDAWTNNIMFKFNGEMLQESVMIDYQVSRVTNPVSDILYLIFNCTDHQSRLKFYYEWLDYYHIELDKALSNYGLKANYVYSRDQLDIDIKRYAKFIFSLCLLFAYILTLKPEDAAKVQAVMADVESSNLFTDAIIGLDSVAGFKARVEGLVDSFVEFGLLCGKQ